MHQVPLNPSYSDIHLACKGFADLITSLEMDVGLIVGISRGGLVPAVIISHLLSVPLETINYSSKSGNGDNKDHTNILPPLHNRTSKNILLIDEISDSGQTLKEITEYYKDSCKIYSYVLYYKAQNNPLSYKPDFHWRKIGPDSGWVVLPWEV